MRVIECTRCGAKVEATSNAQKYCKDCALLMKRKRNESYYATERGKQTRKAYMREYIKQDSYKEKKRIYNALEKTKEKRKAYAKTNAGKAAIKKSRRKYAESEKGKEAQRRWRQSEKGIQTNRRWRSRRRAKEKHVESDNWSWREIWERDRGICQICGFPVYDNKSAPRRLRPHYDHTIPLNNGGTDTRENVRLTHAFCNQHKGDGVADIEYCKDIIRQEIIKFEEEYNGQYRAED